MMLDKGKIFELAAFVVILENSIKEAFIFIVQQWNLFSIALLKFIITGIKKKYPILLLSFPTDAQVLSFNEIFRK